MKVKVEIITNHFGNYSKGEIIEMEKSTAQACAKSKKVRVFVKGDITKKEKAKAAK